MIEGGIPGGSAFAQAAQRRATADKLLTEAAWLEAVAHDERTMASQLATLPSSYSIMHDLRVLGSKGNIDHVVIGPGGAFVVMTRRFDGQLSYHDGQLWAGDSSLKGDFESARVEAQMLTQSLGTAVVPVIGYFGAALPAAAPQALDGVLVCAAENLVRVVNRGSHTLLTPDKVLDAARRAVPLQNSPGSVARGEGAVPPPPPGGRSQAAPALAPPSPSPLGRPTGAPMAAAFASAPPASASNGRVRNEHSGWRRSVTFVAALIVSMCLVAFAAGTLLRVLWADKPGVAGGVDTTLNSGLSAGGESTTTIFLDPTASLVVSPTSAVTPSTSPLVAVPAPVVKFVASCPTPGNGWSMTPLWPGDVLALSAYSVELLLPDATWKSVGSMATSADTAAAVIVGQQPNFTLTVRVTALFAGGGHGPSTTAAIITPSTTC